MWKMLGGHTNRVRAYASSGVHRSVPEMVEVATRAIELGFPAMKVRFGRPTIDDDLSVIKAVREAVGDRLDLMVDCNQGWRMRGTHSSRGPSTTPPTSPCSCRPSTSTGWRSRCTAATTTAWPSYAAA